MQKIEKYIMDKVSENATGKMKELFMTSDDIQPVMQIIVVVIVTITLTPIASQSVILSMMLSIACAIGVYQPLVKLLSVL
jgi:hypothetical protein